MKRLTLPWSRLGLVFLGGTLGTLLRVAILTVSKPRSSDGLFSTTSWTGEIPWRLLVINSVGVLLASYALAGPLRHPAKADFRAFFLPGVLGGLTSYSALILAERAIYLKCPGGAVATLIGVLLVAVFAAILGYRLGHRTNT